MSDKLLFAVPARVPVTILTGFLGAGKTSLLNRLLKEPAFADTAVIVNEFGAVGIDGDLVEEADGRAFAETTGCLCCTVAGDIRETLVRLADSMARGAAPKFSRLVVETTGLADPAPVLRSLMTSDEVIDLYALNGVVTVVDATSGESTLDRFAEARAQVGVADLVLLSKTDIAAPEAAKALRARLRAANPNARLMDAAGAGAADVFGLAAFDPALKPPEVADWLRFDRADDHHHHDHAPNRHGADIEAFCYAGATPVAAWDAQRLITALQDRLGPDLLRLKAICLLEEAPEAPAILHVVQHVMHPPARRKGWPEGAPPATRIVVIARGPERARVPELFATFLPGLAPAGAAREDDPARGHDHDHHHHAHHAPASPAPAGEAAGSDAPRGHAPA